MSPVCHNAGNTCEKKWKHSGLLERMNNAYPDKMKTDLAKEHKTYYQAKANPVLVHVDAVPYISITGKGDPSDKTFAARIQALYVTAYAVKFAAKSRGKDFTVPKLEGLWWFDEEKYKDVGMTDAPAKIPRSQWMYRLLIRIPDHITGEDITTSIEQVRAKKQVLYLKEVHHYTLHEGDCVQVLHTGPFDTEPETLMKLKTFMQEKGFEKNGLHHEIYLSDFRKTSPDKLKTILREPYRKSK